MSKPILEIFVPGIPRPGGSKRAFTIRRKDGSIGARAVDAGKYTMQWRSLVADFAQMRIKSSTTFALKLEVVFFMSRPKAHFNKNGILKSKHEQDLCSKRPDATKLLRAVEDSLSGIVWHDDSQIVEQHVYKVYGDPGALIRVWYADIFSIQTASRLRAA